MKLVLSSIFTLGLLSSFVFFIATFILLQVGTFTPLAAIALTIVINFVLWLVSPWITDHFNVWFYKTKYLSRKEVEDRYPMVADIVAEVSTQYNFPFPKIGIIPDKNPTAFTYGSARYNSRIVLTEGIFKFLNPQEVRAVVAHELGHIVNRDFIVMMIASTLLQILYIIYDIFRRARGKKSGGLRIIALVAYVLYIIGTYLVLYLSRIRELMADEFSTKMSQASDLGNALMKIAYGIVSIEDSESTKKLLQSTRHMGIMDVHNAKHIGASMYIAHDNPAVLAEVMAFDRVSPWAKILELNSTHPLTGSRLHELGKIAKKKGEVFEFDLDPVISRMNIDKVKLYSRFTLGVFIHLLPPIIIIASIVFMVPLYSAFLYVGIGLLVQLIYRYPFFVSVKKTTILDEMRDPYASPIRGKQISLSGSVIGKGVPGYIFGEDMMYQDKTGITYLNYNSIFGFVGNLFFALGKLKSLLSTPSQAEGWFFRGMSSSIALKHITTEKKVVRSHPIFWSLLLPIFLILFSLWGMGTPSNSHLSPAGIWKLYTGSNEEVNDDSEIGSTPDSESKSTKKYSNGWFEYSFAYPETAQVESSYTGIHGSGPIKFTNSNSIHIVDKKSRYYLCRFFSNVPNNTSYHPEKFHYDSSIVWNGLTWYKELQTVTGLPPYGKDTDYVKWTAMENGVTYEFVTLKEYSDHCEPIVKSFSLMTDARENSVTESQAAKKTAMEYTRQKYPSKKFVDGFFVYSAALPDKLVTEVSDQAWVKVNEYEKMLTSTERVLVLEKKLGQWSVSGERIFDSNSRSYIPTDSRVTSPTLTPSPIPTISLIPGRANCTYAPSLYDGDACQGFRMLISNPTEQECGQGFDCERLEGKGVSRACYTRYQCIENANTVN